MIKSRIFPLIAVGLVFVSLSIFKIVKVVGSEHFTTDETCMFWTESAFQYRYAKIVAMGEKIPEIDKKAEFPLGYSVKRCHPVLMESVAGYLYRLIPTGIPFHLFLIILMGFYSSLPIIAIYLMSSLLWNNKWMGVISSILYSLTLSASMTVLNIAYEFQDFAIGFIFFHLFFYLKAESVKANSNKALGYAAISGAFLFISFASWHLTQFYYLVFLVYIMFRLLYDKDYNTNLFFVVSLFVFFAGITIPALKPGNFLLSFPVLFNYCLIFTSISKVKRKWRLIGSICITSGILAILKIKGVSSESGFNVIFSRGILPLVTAKIKGFGVRPVEGAGLGWETLVLWVHPLNNPTISWTIKSFGFLLPAGILSSIAMIIKVLKNKNSMLFILPVYFFFAFFISYLLFERIDVFLVVFLSILSPYIIKRYKKIGTMSLLLLMIPNFIFLINYKPTPPGPNRNYLLQLIRFVSSNTELDAPILANFAYSPTILTWTGRPIIINPKFESPGVVDKVKHFEGLLFKTELEFYRFCKKNRVRYFLLSTDILLSRNYSSTRYRTHNYITTKETVLFKFHFRPEELTKFTLVYSNPHYRIYAVNYPGNPMKQAKFEYFRIYDERNFDFIKLGIK